MSANDAFIEAIPSSVIDYETLRQQGIAWLEKLAGSEWTDFNAHDPGITILEQLCYALTDLSYRINYDMEDLLSREGEDTYDSLYRPEQILVTKPVTLLDLRKLAIDVDGVKNAWLEPVSEAEPPLYHHKTEAETLIELTDEEGASAFSINGLYRVLLEILPTLAINYDSVQQIIREVSRRLHAQRSLAVDFESITPLSSQAIQLQAVVEIEPDTDPEAVYLALLDKIAAYLSPSVRFYSLEECLAQGKSIDEIFDGPLLDHGFIDNQELIGLTRKTTLYTSDLIKEMMDVTGVRIVEYMAFKDNDNFLQLAAGNTFTLDVNKSKLTLKRRQLPLPLNTASLIPRYKDNRHAIANTRLPQQQGRDRHIARYYSLLQQFPKLYGIGETGLPGNASEQRKAQAKQLKAYLLFFDQLLANGFSQLAGIRNLFSFDSVQPLTYFAACLDDPGISGLWQEPDNIKRQQRIQQIFGTSMPGLTDTQRSATLEYTKAQATVDWQRKNRFLDHLLARFAEQFADYIHFGQANDADQSVVNSKFSFLRSYDQISSSKCTGFNTLEAYDNDKNCAGLEKSLRLRLGLKSKEIYVLEHILLRPIAGDQRQTGLPVLSNAFQPDPYSLQVTVVFFLSPDRAGNTEQDKSAFKSFVEQTVRDEAPAHLMVYVHWLDPDQAADFDEAYQDWQNEQREFRMLPLNNQHNLNDTSNDQFASIPLRAARDRLIDWIGIGQTYPLRDLPVTVTNIVLYNDPSQIEIGNSQHGVDYQLCDDKDIPLDPIVSGTGNGGTLVLVSPAIVANTIFTIQATKKQVSGLQTMLLQKHTAIVGLNNKLVASIQKGQPLLDNPKPAPDDDRVVDYGVKVTVAIDKPQEGVDYQLIRIDGDKETALSAIVTGAAGSITLDTKEGVTEDMDIRIRATKSYDKSENKETDTELLLTVLPLKVRANPSLGISVLNTVVDYSGTTSIKVQAAQNQVQYQGLYRSIADHEFVHGAANGLVFTTPVSDKHTVTLRTPTIFSDFDFATNAAQGNDGDLSLSLKNKSNEDIKLTEDSYFAIQAVKTHTAKNGTPKTTSVYLAKVAAVFVRPNLNPDLKLIARVNNSVLQAPVQVTGGQPGIFYEFTTVADSKVQGLPVYFHHLDSMDNTRNVGIGQLQVEVDLVVTTSGSIYPQLSDNITLRSDAELSIRAYKAQSGVEVVFTRKAGDLLVEPK